MRLITILTCAAFLSSGCATIIHSNRQTIQVTGYSADPNAKITTPEGERILSNGAGTITLSRSKSNIPITVECNGKKSEGVIYTSWAAGWGIFGNLFAFGPGLVIGIPIDAINSNGYNINSPVDVSALCQPAAKVEQAKVVTTPPDAASSQTSDHPRPN